MDTQLLEQQVAVYAELANEGNKKLANRETENLQQLCHRAGLNVRSKNKNVLVNALVQMKKKLSRLRSTQRQAELLPGDTGATTKHLRGSKSTGDKAVLLNDQQDIDPYMDGTGLLCPLSQYRMYGVPTQIEHAIELQQLQYTLELWKHKVYGGRMLPTGTPARAQHAAFIAEVKPRVDKPGWQNLLLTWSEINRIKLNATRTRLYDLRRNPNLTTPFQPCGTPAVVAYYSETYELKAESQRIIFGNIYEQQVRAQDSILQDLPDMPLSDAFDDALRATMEYFKPVDVMH